MKKNIKTQLGIIKYCASCALLDKNQKRCMLSTLPVVEETDFCSKHSNTLIKCSFCGNPVLKPTLIARSNLLLCQNCEKYLGNCASCKMANSCIFETSSSKLPKFVVKNIQQGNMTMQTQVRNPERVKITCENGCPCWDKEAQICHKEDKVCGNYKIIGVK